MLSRFSNEVLSRGSSAVLPQNLSVDWLKKLQKLSDDFLDNNFAIDQCTETLEMGDPILVSCVHEILRDNNGAGPEISSGELAENVTIYALSARRAGRCPTSWMDGASGSVPEIWADAMEIKAIKEKKWWSPADTGEIGVGRDG
jgi:hypothetical protein